MSIIIKYFLRNISEKKLRTLLIVVSIMLSSALYLGTIGMSTTLAGMYTNRLKTYFGSAEITVTQGRTSLAYLLRPIMPPAITPDTEYCIGAFQTGAVYKEKGTSVNLNLFGFEMNDVMTMNPFTLAAESGLSPFEGKKLIMGEETAEVLHLKLGDWVKLEVNGAIHRFLIAGIARSQGFFMKGNDDTHTVIAPINSLSGLYGSRGLATTLFLKSRQGIDPEQYLRKVKDAFSRWEVRETVPAKDRLEWTRSVTIPFKIMLVLVLAISMFIIFTSFQVITTERLPVLGTFRSIGATRRTTDLVLFGESAIYGVIGGVFGTALGFGVVYLLVSLSSGDWLKTTGIAIQVTTGQAMQAFFLALGLSLMSSALPIIRVSKLPVKDIILGMAKRKTKSSRARSISGVLLMMGGIFLPRFIPAPLALPLNTVCILAVLAGVVLLLPWAVRMFVCLSEGISRLVLGNVGGLAVKNLKDNPSILNNITLLCIGIAGIFMISTVSDSTARALADQYRLAKYQIQVWSWGMDRRFEGQLRAVPGVTDALGFFTARVKIDGTDRYINQVIGTDTYRFFEFWDYPCSSDRDTLAKELDKGRNILLTYSLKRVLELHEGQEIVLEAEGKKMPYTVIGFMDSIFYNGSFGLVSKRYFKHDARTRWYSSIYVKTGGITNEVAAALRKKFERRRIFLRTVAEMQKQNMEGNQQMFFLLQGFSFMAMLIGVIGVFNNYIISFIDRRRSLALFRSIGMSRRQTVFMLLLESLSGGIIGSLAGLAGGLLIIVVVPNILVALDLPVVLSVSFKISLRMFILGTLVSFIASLVPTLRGSKLNIIEAIKYE